MGMFDFTPGDPTWEAVERRRKLAEALGMQAMGAAPTTFGGGLSAIGAALGGALAGRGADRMDARRAEMGDAAFEAALNGMPQDNTPLAAALGGAYSAPVSASVPPVQASALAPSGNPLRDGIVETAQAIGADPLDLATAISYETAGTFDPTKAGPTTQWGQHRGLIQFGEPQAKQYGVDWNDPIGSQLGANGAVANYFRDRGFKPGMSGMDLYSTINAGSPGRYSASDANNGGAPGDVRDKWQNQMAPHREKAMSLLGGDYQPAASSPAQTGFAPMSMPAPPPVNVALIRAMNNPYMTPEQKQILGGIYAQQQAMQITPYQQAQLQMEQQKMAFGTRPEAVKGLEIGGRLVNPQTGEVMADFSGGAPEFRQASPEEAAAYGAAGGQFGPDGRFYPVNPPSGFAVETGPDGQVRVVQGAGAQGAAGKPFTEGQSKDIVFATRAKGALEAFEPYAEALTSRGERIAEGVPLGLGRGMQTPEFQMAKNAGDEFMQAILRKDTGAAITADEQALYGTTYLPQPGDGPEVLEYKRAARQRAVAAIEAGMSPAQIVAQEMALAPTAAPAAPTSAPSAPSRDFKAIPRVELLAIDPETLSDADLDAYLEALE